MGGLINKTPTIPTRDVFDGFDSMGGVELEKGYKDIPLGTERMISSAFSHFAASAQVNIKREGKYMIFIRCTTTHGRGNDCSESEVRLVGNRGAGFSEVLGSTGIMHNHNAKQGTMTTHITLALNIPKGLKLKIQARKRSGNGPVTTMANGSSLTIMRVG